MANPMPRCERYPKSYYCKNHTGGKFRAGRGYLCQKGIVEYRAWLKEDLRERKEAVRAEIIEATLPSHRPEMERFMQKLDNQSAGELIRELYGEKRK